MASDQILSRLDKEIQEDIDNLFEALANGSCKDFSEYKRMTGEITGLRRALLHVAEMDRRLEKA